MIFYFYAKPLAIAFLECTTPRHEKNPTKLSKVW